MMEAVLLGAPIHWWACPSCDTVDRTQRSDPHTQMHNCPGINGMSVPLIEVATPTTAPDGRHVLVEREDYIGTSGAQSIAAIRTDHGDGSNDCTVIAQTAIASSRGN